MSFFGKNKLAFAGFVIITDSGFGRILAPWIALRSVGAGTVQPANRALLGASVW